MYNDKIGENPANTIKKKEICNIPPPLRLYGVTLVEVLITLVIIGVIAAATIPTLINNTKKQEYVAWLKKIKFRYDASII